MQENRKRNTEPLVNAIALRPARPFRKASWQRRFLRTGLLVASAASLLSCTQPVPSEGTNQLKVLAEKLDFAYDTTLDQISYMSCSQFGSSSYNRSAYYTWRMGAYRQGGVMLNNSFYSVLDGYDLEKQSEVLSLSEINVGTVPQASLRLRSNFQGVYAGNGSTHTANADYTNLLGELGILEMSQLLVNLPEGSRLKSMRNGTPIRSRLEGNLVFNASFAMEQSARNFLVNDGLLALTYSNGTQGGGVMARSPANLVPDAGINSSRIVYGRGFRVEFAQPNVSPLYSRFEPVTLRSIAEVDLGVPSAAFGNGIWNCPASMQFRIIRSEDAGKDVTNCRQQPDPAIPSPELAIVRNSLKTEDWFVDMENRCITPKVAGPGCYGTNQNVVYTQGDSCNSAADGICVAYASICYRTN